jgi:hypothetical protein
MDNLYGFYQVTDKIKTTLEADDFVNTVTYGDIFQVDLNKQTIFPLSHMVVNSATKENNVMRFNFSVIAMDIVNISKSATTNAFRKNDNEQDVLHTQLAVLDRMTEMLRRGGDDNLWQLGNDPTFEAFTERFENFLAGWACTFDLIVPNQMTKC